MTEDQLKAILVALVLPNVSGVKYEEGEKGTGEFATTPIFMKPATLEERLQEAKTVAEKIMESVK